MVGFGGVPFMGWKSNTVVIMAIETCHENKKLQLQSKPAAGLGRGLRRAEALEVSSSLWESAGLAPV